MTSAATETKTKIVRTILTQGQIAYFFGINSEEVARLLRSQYGVISVASLPGILEICSLAYENLEISVFGPSNTFTKSATD